MFKDRSEKPAGRFLSVAECEELVAKARKFSNDLGKTAVTIESNWTGNIRWGRNRIMSCGDVRSNLLSVSRNIVGAWGAAQTEDVSDKALKWAVSRAERFTHLQSENGEDSLYPPYLEPVSDPKIWFDSTFALSAEDRADVAARLIKPAESKGLYASGYVEVSGNGRSINLPGVDAKYIRYSNAQLSVTVRDPQGSGSGWAGIDWNDWSRIDADAITAVALDKCIRSRNPVRIEPGRYTVVLEPQATHDYVRRLFSGMYLSRQFAEDKRMPSPYSGFEPETTKIGLRIFDQRITVSHDPMDPDCSFVPLSYNASVFNAVNWIENGVLKNLSHSREYGIKILGINNGLPSSSAYSMTGGTTSVDEMIESTERGLLVTRFSNISVIDDRSMLQSGFTRDGLWLIEKGKISKAVKNMKFTETPFHTFNNIAALGPPTRVFSPSAPAVVPAVKSLDFSFTATVEAI